MKFLPPTDRIFDWLIFKNETCVALRRSTKNQTYSNLYVCRLPSYGWLCSQSSRHQHFNTETPASGNMASTQSMTSFFQPVKIKQSKKLKLRNVMYNDAKLTWGRSYVKQLQQIE